MKRYGWYAGAFGLSAGNTTLVYWNIVIERYFPNWNSGSFTKANYITALQNMLAVADKDVIVHLPYWFVSGTFNPEDKITEWWPDIVTAIDAHPRVAGYYIFDEPEISGSSFSSAPEVTHAEALSLYQGVKALSEKDCYVVFAIIPFFEAKYAGKAPFWDVFMFDVYPFITPAQFAINQALNPAEHQYIIGTQSELDKARERILRWRNVIARLGYERVVYVGQGSGEFRDGGVPNNFGSRDMNESEFSFITEVLRTYFTTIEGYLLWDWGYTNPTTRALGNAALNAWFADPAIPLGPLAEPPPPNPNPSGNFTDYRTVDGDRWDSVAYKAYGDASKGNLIIAANPYVKADAVLPGGLRLLIPVLEDEPQRTSNLPPWKR
jgi:phage tail protein X